MGTPDTGDWQSDADQLKERGFMQWLNTLVARFRALTRGDLVHGEIDEEVQFHIDMRTEENIERGMSPAKARQDAERGFGNTGLIKDQIWDVRGGGWLEVLWQDLRFGERMLVKRPGFTLAAVVSLALGIGACTAIFSVVDGVLVRPLPYPESDRLVQLLEISATGQQMPVADPNFVDVRARSHSLEGIAEYGGGLATVTGGTEPVRSSVYVVSGDFFRVLGVVPVAGRTFLPEESKPGGTAAAVVSYGFWQRLMAGKKDLTNASLLIGNRSFNVVGVMPPGFSFPRGVDIWTPSEIYPPVSSRTAHNWSVVGRLRPGVSLEQARADLSATVRQLREEYGTQMDAVDMTLIPRQEFQAGSVRSALLILLGAVGLLLLIACTNVANLLLAQATARGKELAIRAALGATGFRLARQFVTEALLLALTGAAMGALLSFWGVWYLVRLDPGSLPGVSGIGVDSRALIFALVLSLAVGMILGIVSALRGSGIDLQSNLKEAGRGESAGVRSSRLRNLLVVAQVALTVVLLIGAGLLGKSFLKLLQVDPGFRPESAVAMDLSLPFPQGEGERRQLALFYRQLMDRLERLPGVTAAGGINSLPMGANGASGTFSLTKNPAITGSAAYRVASQGYFAAMGITLLRGRVFEASDGADSPQVALVSRSLARTSWPNEDPIGQRIQFGNMDGDGRTLSIIGIVGDVREQGLDHEVTPAVYVYYLQRPKKSSNFSVVVRANSDPAALMSAMRAEVKALNPQLPMSFRTIEQVYSSSLDQRRFSLMLFGVFAGVALLLAVTGIYGIISYSVAQRTQELGVRVALGARGRDVLGLVLGGGLKLTIVGIGSGLLAAFPLTRLMVGLLYAVSPADPPTYVAVAVLMIAVTFLACFAPARRAMRVDPIVALKYE